MPTLDCLGAPSAAPDPPLNSMMRMVAKAAAAIGRRLRAGEGIETALCLRLTLVPVVLVFGLVLGHIARWFADGMVVNAQLYFHAFRVHNVRTPWVFAPLHFVSAAVLQYSALASWAVALGYLSARAFTNQRASVAVAGFLTLALMGTGLTTTSVRVAQPWFFDSVITAIAYPLGVKVLFLALPAYLAARAVRRRATSLPSVLIIAVIGIVLAGWNAADLRHGLTYGCVVPAGFGTTHCTSLESVWGMSVAVALAAASALMAWDAWVGRTR
jgi:hypothetical protein